MVTNGKQKSKQVLPNIYKTLTHAPRSEGELYQTLQTLMDIILLLVAVLLPYNRACLSSMKFTFLHPLIFKASEDDAALFCRLRTSVVDLLLVAQELGVLEEFSHWSRADVGGPTTRRRTKSL